MADIHLTIDVDRACRELNSLHECVARTWGRVQITRTGDGAGDANGGGGNDNDASSCVLISKVELDHLERALEILCDLPGGREICEQITALAEREVRTFHDDSADDTMPRLPGALLAGGDGSAAQA